MLKIKFIHIQFLLLIILFQTEICRKCTNLAYCHRTDLSDLLLVYIFIFSSIICIIYIVSYNIVHIDTHIHTQTYQTLWGILFHIY